MSQHPLTEMISTGVNIIIEHSTEHCELAPAEVLLCHTKLRRITVTRAAPFSSAGVGWIKALASVGCLADRITRHPHLALAASSGGFLLVLSSTELGQSLWYLTELIMHTHMYIWL